METVFEKMFQEAQSELKQAQVTAVGAMDLSPPVSVHSHSAQIDDPVVSQAGPDHESRESVRGSNAALVEIKPAAFRIGEQCLNPESFGIETTGFFGGIQIRNQVDGFFTVLPPPAKGKNRPVLLLGEFAARGVKDFARGSLGGHVLEFKGLVLPIERDVGRRAASIVPFPVVDDSLQIGAVKLAIAHENDLGAFGDQGVYLLENSDVVFFGKVSLLALDYKPGDWQSPLLIDHRNHKGHTTAANRAPIYRQHQRVL